MSRILVAYFSATGTTERLAKKIAHAVGADLHEIRPAQPYTGADLDWTNPKSRSSVEMQDKAFRPETVHETLNLQDVDTLVLAFPIWWYTAPTIINTFLEQHDWSGKTILPVATSGGSGMGSTNADLSPSCPGAVLKEGRRFDAGVSESEWKAWFERAVK